MNEREEWIQKYIQKQIGGMTFGSEVERQHMIQQARQSAEAYIQTYQGRSQGNPKQKGFGYRSAVTTKIKISPKVLYRCIERRLGVRVEAIRWLSPEYQKPVFVAPIRGATIDVAILDKYRRYDTKIFINESELVKCFAPVSEVPIKNIIDIGADIAVMFRPIDKHVIKDIELKVTTR